MSYGNPNLGYPPGANIPPRNYYPPPNMNQVPGPGGYQPVNPPVGGPVRKFESNIYLEINFSSNIKPLQTFIPSNQPKIMAKIEHDYNCSVKIEGPNAKTLFMIGFLLAKDTISHNEMTDWKNLQQQVRDSLTGPELGPILLSSQKELFYQYKLAITNLFAKAEGARRDYNVQLSDEAIAVKFLVDQCKSDKEIVIALVYMARCVLIERLARASLTSTVHRGLEKLRGVNWESDDQASVELSSIFCEHFYYRLNIFQVSDYTAVEKLIGQGKAEACIFESTYAQATFKAILFRGQAQQGESMLAGQILTRNKPVMQDINSSPSQLGPPLNNSSSKELDKCNLCGQEIVKKLVYINPNCSHNYCLYCIQELSATHANLSHCYLKRCPYTMDQSKIRLFLSRCAEDQSPVKKQGFGDRMPNQSELQSPNVSAPRGRIFNDSPQTQPSGLKKSMCSICDHEVNESNPIVYINHACGHSICKNWLMQNNPLFEGMCYGSKCPKLLDIIAYKKALKDAGDIKFSAKCNECLRAFDSAQIFINPSCKHRICITCTEKLRSARCPSPSCQASIDEDKLLEFKQEFLMSQDNQNLVKKSMACSACRSQFEVSLPQGSRLDYWKCPSCTKITCTKHGELTSQCLCFCPRCSGSLFEQSGMKICTRCSISYCSKCKRENGVGQKCMCAEGEGSNMNQAQMMKPSLAVSSIMKITTQIRQYDNTCNECNDFRDTPNFFAFECGHRLCEYCIFNKQSGYMPRPLMCSTCSK